MDLTKKTLPNTVAVDGRVFLLNTDFRAWIQFDRDVKKGQPFDCTYLFAADHPDRVDVGIFIPFAQPEKELPRDTKHSDVISLDFDIDADYIYAAFMEQYGIDLIDIPYLHWHKFLALLSGLNESTTLAKIMGYRNYKKRTDKRDPYEELRRAWEIEEPLTEEEQKELEAFEAQFQ